MTENQTNKFIKISVVYALLDRQRIINLEVMEGTNLLEAVSLSQIKDYFPDVDWQEISYAIYGKNIKNPTQHIMQPQDRIEICRPLIKQTLKKMV